MNDQGVAIRRAGTGEAHQVAEVWLRSRRAAIPSIPPPVHDEDDVRSWFENVVLPKADSWVIADSQEGILGLLVLDEGWVDQLYIEPAWSGRGLGTKLLDFAKAARPAGLDLWTFQTNTGARRFYERHGFIALEETDGDNEERAPDVRYHWSGA